MELDVEKFLKPSDRWDAKYRRAVIDAIRKYQPDHAEKIIQRYLSPERRAEFNMVNTYSRRIFRQKLLAAALDLETDLFRPGLVVMWATIADREWAYCDRAINFEYSVAKQKIRNAFTGMNFLGVIEPAYYPEVEWNRDGHLGCLVSFHTHIVVWDTSESKLRRHQRKIRVRFLPVAPDDRRTPRLDQLKTLRDLMKALPTQQKWFLRGMTGRKRTKVRARSGMIATRKACRTQLNNTMRSSSQFIITAYSSLCGNTACSMLGSEAAMVPSFCGMPGRRL